MGIRQRASMQDLVVIYKNFSSHCETSVCLPDVSFCIGPRYQEESHIRCPYRPYCSHQSISTTEVSLAVKRLTLSAHLPAGDVPSQCRRARTFLPPCLLAHPRTFGPVSAQLSWSGVVSIGPEHWDSLFSWLLGMAFREWSNDIFPHGMVIIM